jgi:hypothetical protein
MFALVKARVHGTWYIAWYLLRSTASVGIEKACHAGDFFLLARRRRRGRCKEAAAMEAMAQSWVADADADADADAQLGAT